MVGKGAYGGDLRAWPSWKREERGFDVEAVVRREVEKWVRKEEREAWVEKVLEGGDALCVASLLLRGLPHVVEMGFEGFRLVDPGGRGQVGG